MVKRNRKKRTSPIALMNNIALRKILTREQLIASYGTTSLRWVSRWIMSNVLRFRLG